MITLFPNYRVINSLILPKGLSASVSTFVRVLTGKIGGYITLVG